MGLRTYRKKRDFRATPEPSGARSKTRGYRFVIHKHAATRLHYDLRLELDGVLKSWAVPKGPSLDPADKRLAVEVEDHPIEYGSFEGTIPKGQYGGGTVVLWDRGVWTPKGDPRRGLREGKLEFELRGKKLAGGWTLVRMGRVSEAENKPQWLWIKSRDEHAQAGVDVVAARPESVKTGRTIEDVAAGRSRASRAPKSSVPPDEDGSSSARAPRRAPSGEGRSRARGGGSRAARPSKRPKPVLPSEVSGARRAALPGFIAPELATLVSDAPVGDAWLHEIKLDGYRVLCRLEDGQVRLRTRSGQDWTETFPTVAAAAAGLPARSALLDGEVVVLDADGVSRFQSLQNALSGKSRDAFSYFAFDLLHLDGFDLRGAALEERKRALEALIAAGSEGEIRYSRHVAGRGPEFHAAACGRGLEGIVSKRRDAPYASRRTRDWLKVKCARRQEVVIGGFTEPRGARDALGALLVGVNEDGGLRYAGRVGTGFTSELLRELRARLDRLATDDPPFVDAPRLAGAHWVRPRLVGEVTFTEWTRDGRLRHPSFQGLREDKPASQVVREPVQEPPPPGSEPRPPIREPRKEPPERDPDRHPPAHEPGRKRPVRDPGHAPPVEEPPGEAPRPAARHAAGRATAPARSGHAAATLEVARLTHPDRVLYPESGLTKLDVARYYASVGERMVELIAGRPLMLKRCPEGHTGPCFFQKHPGRGASPSLEPVTIEDAGGPDTYFTIRDVAGLIALVQMGALEIHVWGSRREHLERPDAMVFDIDPDPRTPWNEVIDIARRVREALERFELESFVKTTGGKGLHVVVPLVPAAGWDAVRGFSASIATRLSRAMPDVLTTHLAKAKRKGRVFLDTLRNGRGATWVAPYSTRARLGAPVSAPIEVSELNGRLRPDRWTIANFARRLAAHPDPWARMRRLRQRLTTAMVRAAATEADRSSG